MDSLSTSGEAVGATAPAVGGPRINPVVENWWHGDPWFDDDPARVEAARLKYEQRAKDFEALDALMKFGTANAKHKANPGTPEAK